MFRQIPRLLWIVLVLAVFGWCRAPVESRLHAALVRHHLLIPPPAQNVMEQMGQSALLGTLGGLRSLVSTYLELEAFDHFSNKDWEKLRQTYFIITSLEPREEAHWVAVVWHLGINATANMEIHRTLPQFERERRFKEYAFQAVELANNGISQNPDSVVIRLQLAEVYREKIKDDCEVARLYGEIMHLDGAPAYAKRFHGYFMARCPGREQEAYDYLMNLYQMGESQRLPTLIKEIKKLEEILKLPLMRRIPDPDPDLKRQSRTE